MSYDFARYLNSRSANAPVFAMQGDRIAFLSDITDNFQVWSIGLDADAAAGWPRQLTFLPDKVWELYSTPNAPHLVALSDVAGNERQQFYLITNAGSDVTGAEAHDVRKLTINDQAIHHFGSWSEDGLAIFYRRLERGTFEAPQAANADAKGIELKRSELSLILEGIELTSVKRRRRWSPEAPSP